MPARPTICWITVAGLPVLLAATCAAAFAEEATPAGPISLYAGRDTLPATMLATRAEYAAWLKAQQSARAAVTLGSWHSIDRAAPAGSKADFRPGDRVDLSAAAFDGKPLWTKQPAWKDGRIQALPAVAGVVPGAQACLFRTLTASASTVLTVGIGGGDRIEIWLDGKRTHSLDARMAYERYGTSMRWEGTRRDQLLVDLPLSQGEHQLVLTVRQPVALRNGRFEFCFSPSPDPVPALWEDIRRQFPPSGHRLLSAVEQDWFEGGGWMAASDLAPEKRLLERELPGTGEAEAALRGRLDALVRDDVPAADARWLALCTAAVELSGSLAEIEKVRAAVTALAEEFPDAYDGPRYLAQLDDYRKRLVSEIAAGLDPSTAAGRRLLAELDAARQRMLVAGNPLLTGRKLLFVKRFTYDSQHYYDDYYHGLRKFGGNIFELSLDDGALRPLVPKLDGGVFDRYDLSFDARRIVFGYRAPRPEGYRIWEAGLDGSALRQLSFPPDDEQERIARNSHYSPQALAENPMLYGHWTDDMHPCYLPDGRIAFVSTRPEHTVICGGHALTCTSLFRMNADGGGLVRLSDGALSEFTPTMLSDGRILYNRWEYIYKGIAAVQPLWAMRPDGGGSEEIYGDNITNPGVFVQARQLPGRSDRIITTGCGHEPLAVGAILLVDLHKDKRSPVAMTSLTPDTEARGLRGLWQKRNGQWREDVYGPFYCDPYPLDDKSFLVSCNPDRRYNDMTAYGIYLLDVFGNRVPVYVDPEMSCWQPMLLEPRRRPPVLAAPADRVAENKEDGQAEATVVVTDVYRGMTGVERGAVKYLRVMEQIPRFWCATPKSGGLDAIPGQQPAVSYHTHIWIGVLLGIVPVESDGSVAFKVPADRNVFFQALDESFMEIQGMRTFVDFQPGETRSCIGCHEHRTEAPVGRPIAALSHPPLRPGPQPGETAPRPIHYASDVQPVLDRHCVQCHNADKPDGGLDLSGELTMHFNRSYENLLRGGYVNFIQEWTGPRLENPPSYFTVGGSMAHAEAAPPYTYGSHQSKLISLIRQGHEDVELSQQEFVRLVTWIDANAPYYGSYFGRRNLQFRGHPEFRPVPTLASARGTPPEPIRPKPVPAELLAWWRLDEGRGGRAADASTAGCDAAVVRAAWTPDGRSGGAVRFDGGGYVEPADLGMPETISIAMWVKPDSLAARWNPLVFSNDGNQSAFHFSLLTDGVPNVAINTGGTSWIHNRAGTSIAPGRWHHVAVVCDGRFGGTIRFYVDGRRDAEATLDLGLPLDLDGFRIGAWNRWERSPVNNFHGLVDEVRIYRGMLTDRQVADLAAGTTVAYKDGP